MYSQGLPRAKSKHVDFKFSMTPDAIARHPDLSQGAKNLFGLIMAIYRSSGRHCRLSNDKLAERTGMCVKQVKRNLERLEDMGMIRRILEGRSRLEIQVTWDKMSPSICSGGDIKSAELEEMSPPPGTKCPHMERGGEINLRVFAPLPDEGEEPPVKFDWRRMAAELR